MANKYRSIRGKHQYLLLAIHEVSLSPKPLPSFLLLMRDIMPHRRLALMSVVSSDVLNQQQGMIEFNVALLRKAILQILEAIGQ